MDCKEFRETVDFYVDGELAPMVMAAAQVHLSECVACRRVEAELLLLRQKLKSTVAQHQPPPELVQNVKALTSSRWRTFVTQKFNLDTVRAWFLERRVSLPAPVFVLALLVLIALGLWSVLMPPAKQPLSTTDGKLITGPSGLPDEQGSDEARYFSRFDHGQRASLYKAQR